MREKYIIYYHRYIDGILKLFETTTYGYSQAHAIYNIKQRMEKCGYKNYGIDGTMTLEKEKILNSIYFYDL